MRKSTIQAVACAIAASGMIAYSATPATSAPAAQPPVAIVNADSADAVPGRYIVVFKSQGQGAQAVGAAAVSMARQYGGQIRHTYGAVLDGYSVAMSADEAAEVASDPKVQYVQQVTRMVATDTQTNPPNWGDDRIDQRDLPLNGAYTYPAGPGQGARVYVMDSGLNASHTDFSGRVAAGFDAVDNDSTPQDCHGHGTHVAGTAAGTSYGVAKKATIVAVRVLDCSGSATDDDLIAGMNWVRNNAVKPAVVNYSIGCRQRCTNQTIDNAVKSVIDSGVQWVQAAGNSTDDSCYYSPQRLPEAITVGNSTRTDTRRSDSNWGTCLDIWAPGDNIVSASHSSNTGSATMSGTSMASPHVAGAAALYLAQNPSATPAQVRSALVTNGTTGKLSGINTGSPNVLLYTAFLNNVQPGEVTVANPGNRTATVGQPFAMDNSASGGSAPYTWSATGLPAGLAIDSSTGRISGTPTVETTANVTVTARDKADKTGSATFTITVSKTGGGCPPVTNGTDYAIYDGYTSQSSVTVSGCAGNASSTATVAVNIVHTYVGDLVVSLVAPDGSAYVLHNRAGGSADNINRTYTVNLSGEARNGTWRLRVQDVEVNDTGKIDSWTLTV
ncbi:subtilisin family serine protease [Saccharothrix tamanrassetensis]|uniref:Subtilisin family serine protease n=1 Tax=Saccharothrix tamanrassetensis TaxID=1051531 RepID=A0A841CMR5_9PSEU|nr:S8 family serine peptidase [Saccharothrix tamanrassetensis]MBB5956846.1 subtilisin family serine protease [Saccharothrix tamanrassetensis]